MMSLTPAKTSKHSFKHFLLSNKIRKAAQYLKWYNAAKSEVIQTFVANNSSLNHCTNQVSFFLNRPFCSINSEQLRS